MSRLEMITSRVVTSGALALAALGALAGCSDHATAPGRDLLSAQLVVSEPVPAPPLAAAAPGRAAPAAMEVSYVSLPPGTVPGGTTASIRNQATGASLSVPMVEGGFDPVAIVASVGDELAIDVSGAGGVVASLTVKVPPRRPPKVVRIEPPKGKTDVPLNSRITVVFSEPIDAASVTSASVQLSATGQPVAGAVHVDPSGLTAEFLPAAALRAITEYTLVVEGVRDRSGDTLEGSATSQFTTAFPRIAFHRLDQDGPHIYVTNADGSVTRLTRGGWPAWSPDGRRIAFYRPDDGIYVINADGSGLVRLPGGDGMSWPTWSPDGSSLLGVWGLAALRVVNLDEPSRAKELRALPATVDGYTVSFAWQPRWSPDGRRIVLGVGMLGPGESIGEGSIRKVLVMNADGTDVRRLTADDISHYECDPAWSPDGRQIAFMSYSRNVAVVDIDGETFGQPRSMLSDPWPLVPGGCFYKHPDWSPDGRTLAVAGMTLDMPTDGIVAIDVRTGNVRRLIPESGGTDYAPAWSPVQP